MLQYIYFALSLALPELQKYLLRQEEKHKKKQNIAFLLNNLMFEIIAIRKSFRAIIKSIAQIPREHKASLFKDIANMHFIWVY